MEKLSISKADDATITAMIAKIVLGLSPVVVALEGHRKVAVLRASSKHPPLRLPNFAKDCCAIISLLADGEWRASKTKGQTIAEIYADGQVYQHAGETFERSLCIALLKSTGSVNVVP